MTARKKAARKKVAGRKKPAKKSALAKVEEELPKSLRDFGKAIRKDLNRLEREVEKAIPAARRRIARVIRDASHELGRIEERGETAWKKRVRAATKETHKLTEDAQGLMRKVARDIAPHKPKRKKKAARKKA